MEKPTPIILPDAAETALPEQGRKVQIKRYLRPFLVYGFTIFFNSAISFATFSLLTHHLSEVDYGIINLYNSFIILLMPFIGLGVPFVLNIDYFKMKEAEYREQFTNALALPLLSCVVVTLGAIFLHHYIQRITKINFFFAVTIGFSCLMFLMNDLTLNLLRNKEKYYAFAGFSFAKNILEVSFTVLLVLGLGYNWIGRLSSNLIGLTFAGLVSVFFIYRWHYFTGHFRKSAILSVLLTGLPFIPERLALFAIGYSDRFFIDHYSSTADVGYYGAGAQLAIIVNLSILTLNNTFYPELFKHLAAKPLNTKRIKRVLWFYLGLSALITLAVITCSPLLFKWFIGPKFQPGQVYAVNLAVGLFFWSVYNVFVAFLLSLRKNKLIMGISVFGMLLSLVVNFFNVRHFGALGATFTSILVYFSIAVITLFFVNKYYNLKKLLF